MSALRLLARLVTPHRGRRGRRRPRPVQVVHPISVPPVTDTAPIPSLARNPYPQEKQ